MQEFHHLIAPFFFYLKKLSNQDVDMKEKERILGSLGIGYNSLTTYMQMQLKLSFPRLSLLNYPEAVRRN